VRRAAVFRIDGCEDVVEEGTFVEVGIEPVGPQGKQPPRQLEHIVDVTRLAGPAIDARAQLIGRAEVFSATVSACGVAVMLRDAIPEERRGEKIGRVARITVTRSRTNELWDLTVSVLAGKIVLMPLQWIRERTVFEAVRKIEPSPVAGVGVEIREHFVHSAVLGIQATLNLRVTERREDPLGPPRVLDFYRERVAVVCIPVRIAQSRVCLVQRVPRRPESVQIESGRAYLAL